MNLLQAEREESRGENLHPRLTIRELKPELHGLLYNGHKRWGLPRQQR